MSSDEWHNIDFSKPDEVARFEEFAERRKDVLLELNATYYERGTAYANLIILAGFVGAFSIWAFVKETSLSKLGNLAVGTLLGLSLLIFVGFEIYKMIDGSNRAQRVGDVLRAKNISTKEFLDRIIAIRRTEQARNVTFHYWLWMANVIASAMFALVAIGILFYSMLAVPLGWPMVFG